MESAVDVARQGPPGDLGTGDEDRERDDPAATEQATLHRHAIIPPRLRVYARVARVAQAFAVQRERRRRARRAGGGSPRGRPRDAASSSAATQAPAGPAAPPAQTRTRRSPSRTRRPRAARCGCRRTVAEEALDLLARAVADIGQRGLRSPSACRAHGSPPRASPSPRGPTCTRRPCRRASRCAASRATPAGASLMNETTSCASAASKLSSAHGSSSAGATCASTSGRRARSASTNCGDGSAAATRTPRAASSAAKAPVPRRRRRRSSPPRAPRSRRTTRKLRASTAP